MGLVARTAWVAHVWLTAVMTLVAGLPHFDCWCPNGQLKPFCLGHPAAASGCCCGGGCCRRAGDTPPGRRAKERSCCGRRHRPGGRNTLTARAEVRHPGCSKALARSEVCTPPRVKAAVEQDRTVAALLPPALDGASSLVPRADARASWQVHLLAPPTDLVTLLQHLLI